MKRILFALLLCMTICNCGSDKDGRNDGRDSNQGEFLALTYNVAGLPEPLSGSQPSVNIPKISPLLNAYDLVLVQEDFWYHNELKAQTNHPYKSEPMWEEPDLFHMGDGLNRFSVFPIGEMTRITWVKCSGFLDCSNDCLTTKGFSVSEIDLKDGVAVEVYNLHMDAGSCEGDMGARTLQTGQLLEEIKTRSNNKPVIVAGDTNLKISRPDDMVNFNLLLSEGDLQDACRFLDCGDDTYDRIMFRGSNVVSLTPLSWQHPPEFVDAEGNNLSDHKPVSVLFHWESN